MYRCRASSSESAKNHHDALGHDSPARTGAMVWCMNFHGAATDPAAPSRGLALGLKREYGGS